MNTLRLLFKSVLMPAVAIPRRTMAYCGMVDLPDGPVRYGFATIIDFSGRTYLVPYTCKSYVDDIDVILNNIICDLPAEDYNQSIDTMESVVNQQLTRSYSRNFHVMLYPSAKSMLPPCHNLV
jgi:hypothetical protein